MKQSQLCNIIIPLLEWYDHHARVLPWRENTAPYRVWVSEIMLQQTRVEAGKGYFERFLQALPDIASLASVEERQLLKLWEGLGYYNRARNLQKAAQIVMTRHGGQLPPSYDQLKELPGIGEYTAGAITSISFGIQATAVDGNVLRVIARLTDDHREVTQPKVKRDMTEKLRQLFPIPRIGDFNQSLMELGALICLPNGAPLCGSCPLRECCLAYTRGSQMQLPVKKEKAQKRLEYKTVLLLEWEGNIALRQRPAKGLLAGLWEFPSLPGLMPEIELPPALEEKGIEVKTITPLPAAKHIFTHIIWEMAGYHIQLKECPSALDVVWTDRTLLADYPLPSAYKAYTGYLLGSDEKRGK